MDKLYKRLIVELGGEIAVEAIKCAYAENKKKRNKDNKDMVDEDDNVNNDVKDEDTRLKDVMFEKAIEKIDEDTTKDIGKIICDLMVNGTNKIKNVINNHNDQRKREKEMDNIIKKFNNKYYENMLKNKCNK